MIKMLKVNEKQKAEYIKKGYWTEKTLLDCWEESVAKYADREYVADDRGYRYTYAEIDDKASRIASCLIELGVKPHDVVAFQVPVWSEFVMIAIACLKAGAVLHPIAMFYEKCDLVRAMNLTGAKVYFAPTRFHKTDYENQIINIRQDINALENIIVLDNLSEKTSGFATLTEVIESHEPLRGCRPEGMTGFDVTLILSTSGTTGGSKGVMLTHNNIIYSEAVFNREIGLNKDDIMFMASPLNHATGFHHGIIAPMLLGAKVILQQKFNAETAVDMMNLEGCTYSMGATPFIYDIVKVLKQKDIRIPSMRLYLCGGAPVPGYMVREAYKYGIKVCEVYGSTESVPHAFVRLEEVLELDGRTSGRAISGVEIRVVDENRQDVKPGTPGEEISRGPNVFVGYLKNEEATERVLDDEGWFYSGDLCVADEAGNIRIIGRKKDMIVRGGENLDSNEIDTYIEGCPGVRDHTVIGMPDDRLGERICAYIVPEEGIECMPTVESIAFYMNKNGRPKRFWPERVEIVDEIPRTHSGKVRKYLLQEDIRSKLL